MDATTNKDNLQSCIITTGVSSLNYYNEYMRFCDKSDSLIYNYMGVGSINTIAKVDEYKVIIDFCDNGIKEIIFELLNYLLTFNVKIHVKVIYSLVLSSDDIDQCMILLNRLDKHKLIELQIINKTSESPKEKEVKSWMKKLKNAFFFTGAGNTGKTSLISALSELCNEKGHTVALIDITESNKLINYFTNIYQLVGTELQESNINERIKNNKENTVDVYTLNYETSTDNAVEKMFCESIAKISFIYDYVFVNTDINTAYSKSEIFNIGQKIFIVHDFMPTKISSAKQILLKLGQEGINTKENISLIYNKTIKCCLNIEFIEEKLIFKKLSDRSLVPLVDLDCETFEIPYSKKTMEAMINHISDKRSIINNTPYSYRRNIENIYKYINNIPYVDIGDVDVMEYAKGACYNMLQYTYIKNMKKLVNKYMVYLRNLKKNASYMIYTRIIERHY